MEDLKKQIQSISDYTDQKVVRKIGRTLMLLNTRNNEHQEILRLAREKGLLK